MSWTPPTLETPRLRLRALSLADAPAIFEYACHEEVARYTLWQPHRSVADSESFIREYAFKNYAAETPEPFGITLKDAPNRVIGACGARWESKASQVMELGYVLAPEHWNRGYMSEAVRAVLGYCFSTGQVNRIQAHFKRENAASGKVMENVGMKLEGTQRERVFHNGRYWDTVHYAILKSEWKP